MLSCRADPHLEKRVAAFATEGNYSQSQALRMLIELGLSRGDTLDRAWRAAAFKEGLFRGLRTLRENLNAFIGSAFENIDTTRDE